MSLPSTLYKCKECKKVIARTNPNVRDHSHRHGPCLVQDCKEIKPFSYPQGWCQYCKAEYEIDAKTDLIVTGDLSHAEKIQLGKDIAGEIQEVEEVEEAPVKKSPKKSIKDKFLQKKA